MFITKPNYSCWYIGLALFVALYVIKLFFTPEITVSGDEFEKWYEGRRVVNGLALSRLDHHTARFGIMWPTYAFQTIFGTSPAVYHLLMSAVYAGIGTLGFLIVRAISQHTLLAIVSALLVTSVPLYFSLGSQLMPAPFATLYLFLTLFFLTKFKQNNASISLIVLTALAFMLAYGSKVTSLYVLPAILVYLLATSGKLSTIKFLGILAIFYFIEQFMNWRLLGEFSLFSRLNMMATHMGALEGFVYQPKDIFGRWGLLKPSLLALMLFCMVMSFIILIKKQAHSMPFLLALVLLSYSFFITFSIVSLSPLKFAEPLILRYFLPLVMLAYLSLPILLYTLFNNSVMGALAASTVLIIVNFPGMWAYKNDNVFNVNSYANHIDEHYQSGTWLIFSHGKAARLHRAVYLSDQSLFKDNTKIPEIGRTFSNYFKKGGLHIPVAQNLVKKPTKNQYILLSKAMKEPQVVPFIPPELR